MEVSPEYQAGAFNYWTFGEKYDNPYNHMLGDKTQWMAWDEGWHDARAIDNGDIDGESHPAVCPKGVFYYD